MAANPTPSNRMPKWLLLAIAGKIVAVVLILAVVLWYAGNL